MTRVRVDFNSRGTDGTVHGFRRRSDKPFNLGDAVELYDPAEPDMNFAAIVVRLDPDSGAALFDVDWVRNATEAARPMVGDFGVALPARFSVSFTGVGIAEPTASGVSTDLPPAKYVLGKR